MSEPIAKRDKQRDKVLIWLQMRGARGVLNTELNEICLRYGARIHELRAAGHNITTHKLDDSRYRFVLEGNYWICPKCGAKNYTFGACRYCKGDENKPVNPRPVKAAVQERLFA